VSEVRLTLMAAGHCVHPEHAVLRNWRLRPLQFPATFALIEHPRRGPILFDTGYSQAFLDATQRFPARLYRMVTPVTLRPEDDAVHQLRALGIQPEDVELIIASHFHGDHVAGLGAFPRATILYCDAAWRAVGHLRGLRALRRGFLPELMPADFDQRAEPIDERRFVPLPGECAPFRNGVDLLGDGSLWAVLLPGHAAGQLGLFVRDSRGETVFLCADACWTSQSYRRERMPLAVARLLFDDWHAYRGTLAALATFHRARPGVTIVPSHCVEALACFGVHYDPVARTFSRR
jgi:glyoxylase-like metal-dependent hydrolase (beta-lactamase superfamily II)